MKKNKVIKGLVVSNKMNKTIVVLVVRYIKHRIYEKYIKKSSKIFAHDEFNKCNIGDFVEIKQCRPYSKNKSWVFLKLIK